MRGKGDRLLAVNYIRYRRVERYFGIIDTSTTRKRVNVHVTELELTRLRFVLVLELTRLRFVLVLLRPIRKGV